MNILPQCRSPEISAGDDADDTSLSRLIDVLSTLQKDVSTHTLPQKSIVKNSQLSQTSKPANIFEVLESEDTKDQDRLESPVITSEATPELQAPIPTLSQATEENFYIEDDPLANILEIFFIVLVRFMYLCVLVNANICRSWIVYVLPSECYGSKRALV